MLHRNRLLPALALATGLALPSTASAAPDADTVVARVNGAEITLGHVVIAYATLPQQYKQFPPEQLYDAIVEQLIQQSALRQAYGETPPRHVALSLENEERSLLAAAEVERVMSAAADEESLRAAYETAYGDGFGEEEFNASHILLETEEEAAALKTEIEGGLDFAEAAKAHSTGPSGPNGGALGWFGPGAMVPEFETAVAAMEPGTVSDPVQTQFGWHLIRLNEKRMSEAPSFEDAREELAQGLRDKAVQEHIAATTAAAEVERPEIEDLDPAAIADLSLVRE